MARQTERDELLSAWRALGGSPGGTEGWSTIPLALTGPRRLRAGRHFPGDEEALLVGFTSVHVPPAVQLPQGQGFLVSQIELGAEGNSWLWLALSRRTDGSLEMFTMMALDVIGTLNSGSATTEDRVFQVFLSRIRAWQDFMRRGTDTTLDSEAEIGLFGELVFIRSMMDAGLPPTVAIEGWFGPLNGVHDFVLGGGAVEVKTTIAATGFPATIGSLDQLDDSARQPLFLAAVRIRLDASGMSLPAIIEDTRTRLGEDPAAHHTLNIKLIHAGYLDAFSEHYKRSFAQVATKVLRVEEGFPRLTRTSVPAQVMQARYELNIDGINAGAVAVRTALDQLGVM
jgi:hypothetical protein